MLSRARLKVYALVAAIFLLGASAGAAAAYAASERRLADVLGEDRPDAHEARRFFALSRELSLSEKQRDLVREVLNRHKDQNRQLTRAMFENCGEDLRAQRAKVDAEIRALLDEKQRQRFDELSAKRGARFPFGGPGKGGPGGRRQRD